MDLSAQPFPIEPNNVPVIWSRCGRNRNSWHSEKKNEWWSCRHVTPWWPLPYYDEIWDDLVWRVQHSWELKGFCVFKCASSFGDPILDSSLEYCRKIYYIANYFGKHNFVKKHPPLSWGLSFLHWKVILSAILRQWFEIKVNKWIASLDLLKVL